MRIVQKFGGTSVADIGRILAVAQRVKSEVDDGHQVAVVVSALAGMTNQLIDYCSSISPLHDAREYDVVVASGEQIASGLLAMALHSLGIQARSWPSRTTARLSERDPRQGAFSCFSIGKRRARRCCFL